jgi:DNA-binding transcriptional LysR family regulator
MLDVRRMRVLLEVASRGSMSAAAEALNYTPSAVSQQIATLERESGVALVERGPRSITLTDAGRALAAHADVILAQLEIAEMEVREIAGLSGGRIRLATFRTAGETIMAEAVTTFHRLYPDVELTLKEGEPEDYVADLQAGRLDLALSFEYDFMPRVGIDGAEERLLMEDPIGVALPINHPLADDTVVRLSALSDQDWIGSTPRSSVHAFTQKLCDASGFEARIKFETDDYHIAQALVATGIGVTLLPALAASTLHPGVVWRPLGPTSPSRRLFAVFRAGGLRSPTTNVMVDLLEELGARHGSAPRSLPARPSAGEAPPAVLGEGLR